MFERWTPRARQTVMYAQESAAGEIGVEDLVYGVWREGEGIGARVLRASGYVAPERAAQDRPSTGQIPFTHEAHESLKRASAEADALGHASVGTEHVLLALRPDLRDAVLGALQGE